MYTKVAIIFCLIFPFRIKCQTTKANNDTTTLGSTTVDGSVFDNPEVLCKLQPVTFDCDKSGYTTPNYYYDVKLEDCRAASFGNNCPHNVNKFKSLKTCHHTCRSPGLEPIDYPISNYVYCRLQPDFGLCDSYHPRWYYDMTTKSCKGFSYSGCGGNLNRFDTSRMCHKRCRSIGDL